MIGHHKIICNGRGKRHGIIIHPSRAGFVCVTILAVSLCVPAWAAEFAGGTGEPDDPYQIATASQLLSLGADPNLRTRHFTLVADIDLDPNLPDSELLENGLTLSSGSLDGRGHSILNLGGRVAIEETRRDGTTYYRDGYGSSLFELIGANAVVRNLYLEGAILGGPAMLAGENRGKILNCAVEGSVAGSFAAGLVGTNLGTIMYSHSTCSVTGGSGLVQTNSGTIVACYATGDIIDGSAGLVGSNSGTIRWCSASGDIIAGESWAGGLRPSMEAPSLKAMLPAGWWCWRMQGGSWGAIPERSCSAMPQAAEALRW